MQEIRRTCPIVGEEEEEEEEEEELRRLTFISQRTAHH
jgi:hypothetical protein